MWFLCPVATKGSTGSLKELDFHLNLQILKHEKYRCNCIDLIISHVYVHQCANVNIYNFAIFGQIFMKFLPNCKVNYIPNSLALQLNQTVEL